MTDTVKIHIDNIDTLSLHAGDKLLLSGSVYTARDAAHMQIKHRLDNNIVLGINFKNSCLYYTGPSPSPPGLPAGSAGPTTASRMDALTPMMLQLGVKMIIGKGERAGDLKKCFIEHNAVYMVTYSGAGAYLGSRITKVETVCCDYLGTEAIHKMQFKDFPVIVAYDCYGGDFFEMVKNRYSRS